MIFSISVIGSGLGSDTTPDVDSLYVDPNDIDIVRLTICVCISSQ